MGIYLSCLNFANALFFLSSHSLFGMHSFFVKKNGVEHAIVVRQIDTAGIMHIIVIKAMPSIFSGCALCI